MSYIISPCSICSLSLFHSTTPFLSLLLPLPPSPSPLSSGPPQYKAPTFAVGVEGRPFEVDMGYSSSVPPSSFIWMKNGLAFEGDGDRVKVEYDRLVFSEVQLSDYGRYEVRARNIAGEGSAAIVVKGIYTHVRHSSPHHPYHPPWGSINNPFFYLQPSPLCCTSRMLLSF